MTRRAGLFALGNVLLQDDGWGPYLLRTLEAQFDFPPAVSLHEIGTPGLHLITELSGLDLLLVLDTIRQEGPPGQILCYDQQSLLEHPPPLRLGPHDPSLLEALQTLQFLGEAPSETFLLGAIPAQLQTGIGLSPPLRQAIPQASERIVELLQRFDLAPQRRPSPPPPDFWWEGQGQ